MSEEKGSKPLTTEEIVEIVREQPKVWKFDAKTPSSNKPTRDERRPSPNPEMKNPPEKK